MASRQVEHQVELHLDNGLQVLGEHGQLAHVLGKLLQRVRVAIERVQIAALL